MKQRFIDVLRKFRFGSTKIGFGNEHLTKDDRHPVC